MTLLAVIRTTDGLLVGSDGMRLDTFGIEDIVTQRPTQKLYRITGRDLVFGCAGHGTTFVRFQSWLTSQPVTSWDAVTSWEAFAGAAGQRLAELNGDAQRNLFAAFADQQPSSAQHAYSEALIAGRLGDELGAFKIGMDGATTFLGEDSELFVGSGAGVATIAWEVLKRLTAPSNPYEFGTFRLFLETLAEVVLTLGPPVNIWEIAGETVQKL